MAEEAKKEMVEDATPKKKAFMNKPSNVEGRIKKDEEELKKLMEQDKQPEPTEEKEEEPVNAEEKTFKKRYGDLRRHSQEKEKDFQKQIDELKSQLSQAARKEMKLPRTDEDLENWAKEYPDVAAIVETIAMKKAKEQSDAINEKLKQIDELNAQNAKEKAEVELLRIHPDFADIRESDDFHQWAEEQPQWDSDTGNFASEKEAEETAKAEKDALKASAKGKLIAGEKLSEEEANILVGV